MNSKSVRKSLTRSEYVLLAKVAEQAERFEDVIQCIKTIIRDVDAHLSIDERSLISVAYKIISNDLRTGLKVVSRMSRLPVTTARQAQLALREHKRLENELARICQDIIRLIRDELLPLAQEGEERAFYLKMQGDYYRYLAECSDEAKESFVEQSLTSYKSAYKEALQQLEATHPTRLGIALNFAVFFHDCRNSAERACHVAKHALDDAVAALQRQESLITETIHDSFVILQLLKDDLILWSKEVNW